uniref:Uncharacterized protein n=1 Tax=uncultured Candidatus Melainabacteria bacterium TaxID=2682970 RepID=A0A650EJF1_9BACT|nr:hypothetical protein Melaina855_1200 [uncultured Candidatus Melainabacteria bacterium]
MKPIEYVFSVRNKNKHKIITILGIKLKFTKDNFNYRLWRFKQIKKKEGAGKATKYYVSKYLYAADLAQKELETIPQAKINQLTENLWTMWLQEDVPEPIQMCLSTIKRFYPEIIIITEKNLFEYVNIPEYIYEKYKKGIIKPPHFSDYIRMYLLDKYGGTWIDASCLMLDRIPKFILKQPFFILQTPNKKEISNFFIHSGKNNFITKTIKIYLEEYWKHENITIDYFLYHHYFNFIRRAIPRFEQLYNNIIPYLNSKVRYLTDNIAQNADKDAWEYLSKTSFMYKFQRKNKNAVKNPNSWYNFLLNEYRNGKLLSNIDSTAV